MRLLALLTFCLAVMGMQACSLPPPNCPDKVVKKDFEVEKYLGRWYEIARVPTPYQKFGQCVTATYSTSSDETYPVKVLNRQFNESSKEYETRLGGARLASPDSLPLEGKLFVFFPPPASSGRESNYWVLDTDYDNYSLVYSCNEQNGGYTRSIWILSRKPTLSDEFMIQVDASIARNLLDPTTLVVTDQSASCVYEDVNE